MSWYFWIAIGAWLGAATFNPGSFKKASWESIYLGVLACLIWPVFLPLCRFGWQNPFATNSQGDK